MSDVVIVGGGIGGSALATVLARKGLKVLVLEREAKFRDRVRGENMHPWGVACARRLGLLDAFIAAGGAPSPIFNIWTMGMHTVARPLAQTGPNGEGLNIYHPDLQEASLAAAVEAGAEVKRGVGVRGLVERDGKYSISYVENEQEKTISARLVVGADGRSSRMREWGGFQVERDPENLRIAGTIVENANVPGDGTVIAFGPGVMTFLAPLGAKRVRTYFVYPGATGDRKLSGKDKNDEFLDAVRTTMVPSTWFEGATVNGPLAEFEGADHWVTSPAKPGLALIGDAAAATDPSWGCGLSKTLLDVESLSSCLSETDDWNAAVAKYVTKHNDYAKKLHDILGWLTILFWTPGPEGDERRKKVGMGMKTNPMGYPDLAGLGPFGPSDESARRLILGLD